MSKTSTRSKNSVIDFALKGKFIPNAPISQSILNWWGANFRLPDGGDVNAASEKRIHDALTRFDKKAKKMLRTASVAYADETDIKMGDKNHWLHCVSNETWTYYHPHEERGLEAIIDIGILTKFKGVLCRDYRKPYFKLDCDHALCNAQILEALTRAWERDGQHWTLKMKNFLKGIDKKVVNAGGALSSGQSKKYRVQYRKVIKSAKIENLSAHQIAKNKKKIPVDLVEKKTSLLLLDRLQKNEDHVLKFMEKKSVAFSICPCKEDFQMKKAKKVLSTKFGTLDTARQLCRILSYLSTCRKQGLDENRALELLQEGNLPEFTP